MSKQESNQTKRNLLRRGLAGILLLAMLFGLLPSTVFTAHAASWADPYCQTLVDWGVMRGDINGNLAPDRSITRAEFVTMMNRAYGYTKLGGNPFTDVRVTDWYYEDIDIGYNIGYFKGTAPTKASPNDTLTREQAAVLLARNMMLQETVGETLGFSDSRTLSEWSRGLVGAAAASGIISGYDDGSFQPFKNITRGEVAAMLVRAIGTPINTEGEHALGNVYGNVTVNTSGVKLRDGVIVGNLYLTGGIDLGEVLLENVTVLGEIIVSGGGESNSSASSIIMRNVVADGMIVDSISDQFVTIRAEGNTDIPTTTVRTNAYVDDSSLPGYGLSHITLDGDEGALLQLAGNIKDVVNKTPGSDLQVVQGVADKITVDENATGSSVLVDGDARVDDLNLDTATTVTGTGDIGNLNVGAAGSTVEQLPDNITIRPGITTDINGSTMNSTQAAESSSDPKLLAGYPAVKQIAPTSATLVFKTNKTGTVYWAVSAVADGSVKEEDLLEPPVYGGNILKSGSVSVTEANKEITAAVTGLTRDGSYYVTAMLVDGRGEHSPIKVTSFTTPDDTVPAFANGYPYMSKITCDEAQVTVMTTKSCLLYYALLPDGAAQPTPAEFKAAAIPGNLGYGSLSVTKNVTMPFPVNREKLDEKTNYVLYLWLTDHDGAKSSAVTALRFTTPDETPPVVTDIYQSGETATSIRVNYTIDEPADLVWVLVTEGDHMAQRFLPWTKENFDPNNEEKSTLEFADEAALQAAKVWMVGGGSGATVVASGSGRTNPLNINNIRNTTTSSFVLYYIANDRATTTGNLSTQIKALRVHTTDEINPTAELLFTNKDQSQVKEEPDADADVSIIFSENVKGGTVKGQNIFLNLYEAVKRAEDNLAQNLGNSEYEQALASAKSTLGQTLANYIVLYRGTSPTGNEVKDVQDKDLKEGENWINWDNAVVEMMSDGSGKVEVRLPTVKKADGTIDKEKSALSLDSGVDYYFRLAGITDLATSNNPLVPVPDPTPGNNPKPVFLPFKTSFAKVNLAESEILTIDNATGDNPDNKNDPKRADVSFTAKPITVEKVGEGIYWDMMIWVNTSMTFTLYSRDISTNPVGAWEKEGTATVTVDPREGSSYVSLNRELRKVDESMSTYKELRELKDREYAIHIDEMLGTTDATAWNHVLKTRVTIVAGSQIALYRNITSGNQATYDRALGLGITSIEQPKDFTITTPIEVLAAPGLQPGYPSITVGDTWANVTVALDKEGIVYYLALPITTMIDDTGKTIDNSITTLTEDVIKTIDTSTYGMRYAPLEKDSGNRPAVKDVPKMFNDGAKTTDKKLYVSNPTRTQVMDGRLKNVSPYAQDVTRKLDIMEEETIRLTGLNANTVYYLFLVTRSQSDNSPTVNYSDTYCYRFTTKEPIRPTINARGGGDSAITIIVNQDTTLWYHLAHNGREGELFKKLFKDGYADNNLFAKTTTSGSGSYIYNDTTSGEKIYFTYTRKNSLNDISIVDAMATGCYNGANMTDEGYLGSLFDLFATDSAKSTFRTEVLNSNPSDGEYLFPGNDEKFETGSTPISFKNLPSGSYTFLSVGQSTQGSGYSFRAYYSVTSGGSGHPTVDQFVDLGGQDVGGVYTGKIQLQFSTDLFGGDPESGYWDPQKLDNCMLLTTGHSSLYDTVDTDDRTYSSLGYFARANTSTTAASGITVDGLSSTHTPTEVGAEITFNLTKIAYDVPVNYRFRKGLCDRSGNGMDEALSFNVTVHKTPKNPDDLTEGYNYSVEVDILSSGWNGMV